MDVAKKVTVEQDYSLISLYLSITNKFNYFKIVYPLKIRYFSCDECERVLPCAV